MEVLTRRARERAGLTQAQLAVRLGVSQPAVSDWENGRKPIPTARLADIAAVLTEARVSKGCKPPEAIDTSRG